MITKRLLEEANALIKTIDIKGKAYAPVSEQVRAFRTFFPGFSIFTEILSNEDGVVVIKATVLDEEARTISTGLAYEKEGSSFINKTSYIENCETSAVGRALSFFGLGIDESIASADELANAIKQQEDISKYASELEKKTFKDICSKHGIVAKDILANVGWKAGYKLTREQLDEAQIILKDMIDGAR